MDPLAQLHDIHLPEQVHNYPVAIGWWILASLLLIALIIAVIAFRKYLKKHKAQKQAIKQITDNNLNNEEIMTVIKWACLQYFPRIDVAKLHGEKLLQFMTSYLPEKQQETFLQLATPAFQLQYQSSVNTPACSQLKQATILWLKQALPPKELTQQTAKTNKSVNLTAKVNND